MRAAALLLLAIMIAAALGGCGQKLSDSPSPLPKTVAYSDPGALYRAIAEVGTPRIGYFGSGVFAPEDGVPVAAHGLRGWFAVSIASDRYGLTFDDGVPCTGVAVGVFPDAASRSQGVGYGGHLAELQGDSTEPQLQGPNWLVWGDEEALRAIQTAIGGELGRTPALTPSPGAGS